MEPFQCKSHVPITLFFIEVQLFMNSCYCLFQVCSSYVPLIAAQYEGFYDMKLGLRIWDFVPGDVMVGKWIGCRWSCVFLHQLEEEQAPVI